MDSLTRLYTVGWTTSTSHLDIPKMIMDSSKNRSWNIPFQEFSRLRVNFLCYNVIYKTLFFSQFQVFMRQIYQLMVLDSSSSLNISQFTWTNWASTYLLTSHIIYITTLVIYSLIFLCQAFKKYWFFKKKKVVSKLS